MSKTIRSTSYNEDKDKRCKKHKKYIIETKKKRKITKDNLIFYDDLDE